MVTFPPTREEVDELEATMVDARASARPVVDASISQRMEKSCGQGLAL